MSKWTKSGACKSRRHCKACRTSLAFRESVVKNKLDDNPEFACPHGFTADHLPGLGDKVEAAVKPMAKALKLPCLDEQGNLKPESGCAKRRDALNKLSQ